MSTKKPITEKEWAGFWEKNKRLSQQLKERNKTYIDLTDLAFKNSLAEITQETLKQMLISMKSTREFYKKILQEPYYTEHPEKKNTSRYTNTEKKYKSINAKGKIVHSLITL